MALSGKRRSTAILGTLASAIALIAAARVHPRADLTFFMLFLLILWAIGGWIKFGVWYTKDFRLRRLGKRFRSRAETSLRYFVNSEEDEIPYEVSAGLGVIFGQIDRYEQKSSGRKAFAEIILTMLLIFAAQGKMRQVDINTVEISALSPVEVLRLAFFVMGYYFSLVPSALAKQQGPLNRALQQSFSDLAHDFRSHNSVRRESESATRFDQEAQGRVAEEMENEASLPSSVTTLLQRRPQLAWNHLVGNVSAFATLISLVIVFDDPPRSIGLDLAITLIIALGMLIAWRLWNGRHRSY